MNRLAIIGAGSWGTALAIVLAPRFAEVGLWVYEKDLAARMDSSRENDIYLPGFTLPANVKVASDLFAVIDHSNIVLGVMPSNRARGIYERILPSLKESTILVSATKGIENESLLRISEVIAQFGRRALVLSGPTFAKEVARGEPTALVIAGSDSDAIMLVQGAFSSGNFRLYTNFDPIGVEIGAAVKNVVAIGAGVCHGLGLGSNAVAALITRGLAEITRLAVAAGGQARTLSGLTGLGDLVLTCNGSLSRNRTVGLKLASGEKLDEIVASMKMVAEGIETTKATKDLAAKLNIEMPIVDQMYAMLYESRPPREAIRRLMERSLKGE